MKTKSVVLFAVGILIFAQFAYAGDSLITSEIKKQKQESKIISDKDTNQYITPEQFLTPYPEPSSAPYGVRYKGIESRNITESAGTQLTDLPAFQIHITHHGELDFKYHQIKMNGPFVSNVGAPDQQWQGDILATKSTNTGNTMTGIADTFKKVRGAFKNNSSASVHHFDKKTLDKIDSLVHYNADQTFSFFIDRKSGDIICKLQVRQPYPDGTYRRLSLLTSGKTFESAMEKAVDKILKDHELCEAEAFAHHPLLSNNLEHIANTGNLKGPEALGNMLICAPKLDKKRRKNADKPLDERVNTDVLVKKVTDSVKTGIDSKKEDVEADSAQ